MKGCLEFYLIHRKPSENEVQDLYLQRKIISKPLVLMQMGQSFGRRMNEAVFLFLAFATG